MVVFAALAPEAQADPGTGGFVTVAAGAELEGAEGPRGAAGVRGARTSVEAGWLWRGGVIFNFETGVRGAPDELGLIGGARVFLLLEPGPLGLRPLIRGGLNLGGRRAGDGGLRAVLGPYVGAGLSRALVEGIELTLMALVVANVTPFEMTVSGAVGLTARSW